MEASELLELQQHWVVLQGPMCCCWTIDSLAVALACALICKRAWKRREPPEALGEKSNQQFGVFSTEIPKAGSRVDRDHGSWHKHSTPILHTSANLNPQFRRHLFIWFPYLTAIMCHEAVGDTFKFLVFCYFEAGSHEAYAVLEPII